MDLRCKNVRRVISVYISDVSVHDSSSFVMNNRDKREINYAQNPFESISEPFCVEIFW